MHQNQLNDSHASHYGAVSSSDRSLWQQIINDWARSGMGQRKFCEYHGLNKNTFSYWRGKFLEETKGETTTSKTFVPVKVKSSDTTHSELSIKLQTPQGYVLSIPFRAGDKLLQQLLTAIGVIHA